MREYYEIGIDKVHSKFIMPIMSKNYDFHNEGWIVGSQKAEASIDEYGNKHLTATGITYRSPDNSLYIENNIPLRCAYVQFNPTTIDSNDDFTLRTDFKYIIPKIQEQLYEAGVTNAECFGIASLSRLDPAIDCSSKFATELFLPSLKTYSNYSRGRKDLNYEHGITFGNHSQEIGTYNRSLHLTTNKGIDTSLIHPNVTRNELRLFGKGKRAWMDKIQLYTINDLYSLDPARIKDIHKQYFDRLRLRLPPLTKKPIISHIKMLKNYQNEYGSKAQQLYAMDKMYFEFVSEYGIVKTIDLLIPDSITLKGGNNRSQAKSHRRERIDEALLRYNRLTEYEATQRELINEFKEMFA